MLLHTFASLTSFTENLIALCCAPKDDILACVTEARHHIASELKTACAPVPLVLLATADLLETALTRAVAVIQAAPGYRLLRTDALRAQFLALHLDGVIVGWIRERCSSPKEFAVLVLVEKAILSKNR